MRNLGFIALAAAGAGLGYLLFTGKGRALARQAGDAVTDQYRRAGEALGAPSPVEGMIEEALEQPHPDTAMAGAFQEAVA